MLRRIVIENFALIENMEIDFGEHFNVLSGETGVGKSILVDAIKLLMGERANAYDIRYGSSYAIVEGVFDWPTSKEFQTIAKECGVHEDESHILILRREIRDNGRNICRVNGNTILLNQYRRLAENLIHIFGQHDQANILDHKKQLQMLDAFIDDKRHLKDLKIAERYQEAKTAGRLYKKMLKKKTQLTSEMNHLHNLIKELDSYKLKAGEADELQQIYEQLAYISSIQNTLHEAYQSLYGRDSSAYGLVSKIKSNLDKIPVENEKMTQYKRTLKALSIGLKELSLDIMAYNDELPDLPKLDEIEERIHLFDRLERQYNKPIEEIIVWYEEQKHRLDDYLQIDDDLSLWQKDYMQKKAVFEKATQDLTQLRQEAAVVLGTRLKRELSDLAMEKTHFEVDFKETPGDETGRDMVQFLFSTNPGIPLMPVDQVASGGEMSRIMLAIQTTLGDSEGENTFIFDEIDTGIGGTILGKVAKKLSTVAQKNQVICVTHAPVIAALSNDLFALNKKEENNMTSTFIQHLDKEEDVILELARMLGGYSDWHIKQAKGLRHGDL